MLTTTEGTSPALALSELRYRRLFEAAQDGILILDAESGRVLDVNPFLTATLGYTYPQVVGRTLWEAVGRLAGGIAHDFSNLQAGILGCAEQCRERIGPHDALRVWLDEITHNAQRSAEIARQLLAFACKQDLAPRVLDLNTTISDMLPLLRRLVGENIPLNWNPGTDSTLVKIAPTQISRILANLCLNARDAITGAGAITLSTHSLTIGEGDGHPHADAKPGPYAVLVIGDIDLLLTDLMMPGMDGVQLANRLCSVRPALKVLVMSGCPGDDLTRKGLSEGAPTFLSKPFTRLQLASKVHKVLQGP